MATKKIDPAGEVSAKKGVKQDQTKTAVSNIKNMMLWDQVCETNPADTKNVGTGKYQYTAIDAQVQRKQATAMFGPFGIGWTVKEEVFETILLDPSEHRSTRLIYRAIFSYNYNGITGQFPICSEINFYNHNTFKDTYYMDNEVYKKVRTDAMTKGLSELGFNSDVFEGRYDDNKYVEEMKEKFKDDPKPKAQDAPKPEAAGNKSPSGNTGNSGTPKASPKPAAKTVAEGQIPENESDSKEIPLFDEPPQDIGSGSGEANEGFPSHDPVNINSMFQAAVEVVNTATKRGIPPAHIPTIMALASKSKRNNSVEEMVQFMGSLKLYLGQNPAEKETTIKAFLERAKK